MQDFATGGGGAIRIIDVLQFLFFPPNCSHPPTHPKFRFKNIGDFSISQLPILNILCCLLSTKCTATLLKDRFNGEYYKILEETTKPFEGGKGTIRSFFSSLKSKFLKFRFSIFTFYPPTHIFEKKKSLIIMNGA